ncbi:MAG: hypothetical protein IAE82_02005 [Opitutaceae bacterium]|nr:hypothetical protein [Opitutaceae bacterium]
MPWTTRKKLLVGVPATLVGVALLVFVAGRAFCYHSLERATEAFRKRGFPTQIAEIVPTSVSESDNSAPLLAQATALLQALEPDSTDAQAIDALIEQDRTKQNLPVAEAALKFAHYDRQPIHELVLLAREAAQRPLNLPNRDYALGPALEMPELGTTRTLSQILATRVYLGLILENSVDEAWSDISVQFGLAELASQPPTLIDSLTGVACRRITFGSLQATIDAGQFVRAHDSLLKAMLQSDLRWHDHMVNMLHGERFVFLDWFTTEFMAHDDWVNEIAALAAGNDGRPRRRVPQLVGSLLRPLAAFDLSHAYRYHFEIVDAVASQPSHEVYPAIASAEQRVTSTRWPLTAISAPMLGKILKTHHAAWSEQRVWTIALASASLRASSGQWPQTITELCLPPELLLDPCSGNPIHFVATAEEIVIYADGLDRKDDGGTPWQSLAEASVERGDIVVALKLSR